MFKTSWYVLVKLYIACSLALVGAYVLAWELKEAQGDYSKAFISYEKEIKLR